MVNLNGTGSTRETWHVEIAADAPGFSYLPGDAIGIVPENDPDLALGLAEAVGLGADGVVVKKLRESYDVTTLSRSLIEGRSTRTFPPGKNHLLIRKAPICRNSSTICSARPGSWKRRSGNRLPKWKGMSCCLPWGISLRNWKINIRVTRESRPILKAAKRTFWRESTSSVPPRGQR
jgi:hypothetical protein